MTAALKLGMTAGVPEDLYHQGIVDGESSLSHSGMKTLLGKTPFHFRHEVLHPEDRVQKKSFDLGSAAHAYVLGAGAEQIAEIRKGGNDAHPFGTGEPYDDFRTKDAQTKRDLAYAMNLTPILAKDVERVHAMVAELRRHPLASELLAPGSGTPEVSAFVRDPESGVLLRARFDWLRNDNRAIDFKTVGRLADPRSFSKAAFEYGYFLQDPTYRHVAALCDYSIEEFHFVLQETTPPYAVSVCHLGPATLELGRLKMRQAIALYAACVAAGEWPAYSQESVEVDVPFWALRELDAVAAVDSDDDSPDSAVAGDVLAFLDSLNV